MWAGLSAIFQAIAAALGLVKQRDAEKNAAPMIAAKRAQDAQNQRDSDVKLDADATQMADVEKHDAALKKVREEDSL